MNRNIGIAIMMLAALIVLGLSFLSLNWLGGITGGAFLITGLASWKTKAGLKYALGAGLIILASSIPFLLSREPPSYYGTVGTIASLAFLSGALIALRY
jgi:hypothetical protein